MNRWIGFLFYAGAFSLMISCATNHEIRVPEKKLTLRELPIIFADREKKWMSMKGMVAVSFSPEQGPVQKIHGILSFDQDEKVRFQGFDPLGRTLVDLTAVNDLYRLVWGGNPPLKGNLAEHQSLQFRSGPGENDLIPWNSWLKTMKEIRLGGNPSAGDHEVLVMEREGEEIVCSIIRIEGKSGVIKKRIWLETRFYKPTREEIYQESARNELGLAELLQFEYKNREDKNVWPDKIKVKLPEGELSVEFLEVNFSPVFSPHFFNLD
ncbi:MAG: hypothetical protein HY200_03265 [Nitrospirae bacterium]|nr:hypothetical protein [Nitrospirota bacterium]